MTTITWTATDVEGLTAKASQTVTVRDAQNPSITAPADKSEGNDPGLASRVLAAGSPTAGDNCPDVTVSNSRSDGLALAAPFPVGLTTITWTATDAAGNTASATQSITVRDIEAPTLTVPASMKVSATSASGALVNYSDLVERQRRRDEQLVLARLGHDVPVGPDDRDVQRQ